MGSPLALCAKGSAGGGHTVEPSQRGLRRQRDIRVERHLAGVEPRIELQVETTEAGVDPEARELLDNLPRLNDALSRAEPELRRRVSDAFRRRS